MLGEADLAYLLGLPQPHREYILTERAKKESDIQNRHRIIEQANAAMNGGNGAGPSRPTSTYRVDISRTEEVDQSAPMTRARTGALFKVSIE